MRHVFFSLCIVVVLHAQRRPGEPFGRPPGEAGLDPARRRGDFEEPYFRDRDRDRTEDSRSDSFAARGVFSLEVAKTLRDSGAGRVYMDLLLATKSGERFGMDLVVVSADGRVRLIETRMSGRGRERGAEVERALQNGEELTVLSSPRVGLGESDGRFERGTRFRPSTIEIVDRNTLRSWRDNGDKPDPRANDPDSIQTSRSRILQDPAPEAVRARKFVEDGATLYRIGEFGKNAAGEAQFWSFENPGLLSRADFEQYRQRYGIPEADTVHFIVSGRLRSGARFVTRYSEPIGARKGGGLEVVTEPGAVEILGTTAVQN